MLAKEARKISKDNYLSNIPINEVDFILDSIEKAASTGFLSVYYFNPNKLTIKYLTKLGYNITNDNSVYYFSWELTCWQKICKYFKRQCK